MRLCYLAKVRWVIGLLDQALEAMSEAQRRAQALEHPYTLAIASALAGWFHQIRGDERTAEIHADAGIALSGEHGFSLWRAQGHAVRGWSQARQGRPEGLEELREGYAGWRATGAERAAPTRRRVIWPLAGRLTSPRSACSRPVEVDRVEEGSMAQPALPPWIQALQQRDPEFVSSYMAQRERILRDGAIPAKYKLLMTMVVDALLSHPDGVANIAARARGAGASDAEIQEAVEVAYLFGGTPALVTAVNAFRTP